MDIYTMPRLRTEVIDDRNGKVYATVESLIPQLNQLTTELIEKAQRKAMESFDAESYVEQQYVKTLKAKLDEVVRRECAYQAELTAEKIISELTQPTQSEA